MKENTKKRIPKQTDKYNFEFEEYKETTRPMGQGEVKASERSLLLINR